MKTNYPNFIVVNAPRIRYTYPSSMSSEKVLISLLLPSDLSSSLLSPEPVPSKQYAPQLFTQNSDKTQEAVLLFEVLEKCTYASKHLGSSGQLEYMTCDCEEDWDPETGINRACGEDSYCINRVTSVECVEGHCHCGSHCQNQRFQRRQYASVLVIKTEKKGYGLRADSPLSAQDFIYEYIGEVIDESAFRARMIEYDTRNFKHFYFMMLKGDSFIDATERGSLARFCNHSCRPNAYVDKWMVGGKLRMGIFAKRAILQGEEITFDYNVDRYGAESQPCYCGESNCVKFMGGKTQTDAALLLPDGIAEALGVSPKQERAWLKQNKHLRSKQQSEDALINQEFVRSLEVSELKSDDVSKVMGALMKNQDPEITKKLVDRVLMTNDEATNMLIIKYHGYKTFSTILLQMWDQDETLVEDVLIILGKWPAVTRNKILSLNIENVINEIAAKSKNQTVHRLCTDLLEEWSKLKMAYRIPKASSESYLNLYGRKLSRSPERKAEVSERSVSEEYNGQRSDADINEIASPSPAAGKVLPPGWEDAFDEKTKTVYYYNRSTGVSKWEFPEQSPVTDNAAKQIPTGPAQQQKTPTGPKALGLSAKQSVAIPSQTLGTAKDDEPKKEPKNSKKKDLLLEIQLARREQERILQEKQEQYAKHMEREQELRMLISQSGEEHKRKRLEEQRLADEKAARRNRGSSKSPSNLKSKLHGDSIEAQWTKVLAKYIPNFIKKHEQEIGRDNIKGCARDLVKILCQKQLKRDATSPPPSQLDSAKLKKIQAFAQEFMARFLVKYRAKKDRKRSANGDDHAITENDSGADKKRIRT